MASREAILPLHAIKETEGFPKDGGQREKLVYGHLSLSNENIHCKHVTVLLGNIGVISGPGIRGVELTKGNGKENDI
jgi:hypothetical protein